jgi:hypothetical protein
MIGELCFPISHYTVMHGPHKGDTFSGFLLTKLTQFESFTDHGQRKPLWL